LGQWLEVKVLAKDRRLSDDEAVRIAAVIWGLFIRLTPPPADPRAARPEPLQRLH
jgi:hypothetical protein